MPETTHFKTTFEDSVLLAVERIGGVLAMYGKAYTYIGDRSARNANLQETDELGAADMLRGELMISGQQTEVRYYFTDSAELPDQLLTFTMGTYNKPAYPLARPRDQRTAGETELHSRYSLFCMVGRTGTIRAVTQPDSHYFALADEGLQEIHRELADAQPLNPVKAEAFIDKK